MIICGVRRNKIAAEQEIYNALIMETRGIRRWCYSSRHRPTPRLGTADKCTYPTVFTSMTQKRDLACRTGGFWSCASTFGLNDHRMVPVEYLHLAGKHVSAPRGNHRGQCDASSSTKTWTFSQTRPETGQSFTMHVWNRFQWSFMAVKWLSLFCPLLETNTNKASNVQDTATWIAVTRLLCQIHRKPVHAKNAKSISLVHGKMREVWLICIGAWNLTEAHHIWSLKGLGESGIHSTWVSSPKQWVVGPGKKQ